MKKIIISFIVLAVLISCGIFALNKYINTSVPDTVSIAENALATNDLLLIGHVNNSRIKKLKNLVSSSDTDSSVIAVIPGEISELLKNPAYELDQVIFSLNGDDDSKPSFKAIAYGKFDAINFLKDNTNNKSEIFKLGNNLFKLSVKETNNENDKFECPDDKKKEISKPEYYFEVLENRILLTFSEEDLRNLSTRLANKKKSNINLSNWQNYRSNNLISVTALNPLSSTNAGSGMSKLVAQNMLKDVDSLSIAVKPNLLKRGIVFESELNASSEWIDKTDKAVHDLMDKAFGQSIVNSPTFNKLLKSISTESKSSSFKIGFTINATSISDIKQTLEEVIQSAFSSISVKMDDDESTSEEQLDKNPWDYTKNLAFKNLPIFKYDPSELPPFNDGAFAVYLEKLKVGDKTDLIEMSLKGHMQLPEGFDSLYNSGAELGFSVTAIENTSGENMIRDERCIKKDKNDYFFTKNHELAKGTSSSNDKAYLTKTIRLTQGVQFKDIKKVKGKLTFSAPVEITSIQLKTQVGAVAEHNGVKISITKLGKQKVTYKVTGDIDKLLDTSAFNSKNQKLAGSQSSSFGSEKSKTSTDYFHGNIEALEFYIVDKFANHAIEYEFDPQYLFAKSAASEKYKYKPAKTLSTSILKKFNKIKTESIDITKSNGYWDDKKPLLGSVSQPAFKAHLYHEHDSWNNKPKLEILIPFIPDLANNLGAIELQTSLFSESENTISKYIEFNPNYWDGKYQSNFDLNKLPLYLINTNINLDLEQGTKINQLDSKLIIRLPKAFETTRLASPQLIEKKNLDDKRFYLKSISNNFGETELTYVYSGTPHELINIALVTKTGAKFQPSNSEFKDGNWELSFKNQNNIDHFELITSNNQDIIAYPFIIKPVYPNDK